MALFVWSDKMSVGIGKIDREHMGLFDIMNKLHEEMLAGRGKDILGQVLTKLMDYTKVHFGNEEALLRQHGYPGLADHIKLHEGFKHKVAELDAKLKAGNVSLAVSALDFLRDWLIKHIQGVDFQYKPFLASKGVK